MNSHSRFPPFPHYRIASARVRGPRARRPGLAEVRVARRASRAEVSWRQIRKSHNQWFGYPAASYGRSN
eukprot:scaffold58483_cov66-Phaeocystis_antarctica.AAC.2